MAYGIHERIIFELGPHRTLPGIWWIKFSDKQLILLTPWIMLAFYDGALDFNRVATRCGWEIAWKRASLTDNGPLFVRNRSHLEYKYIN